MKKSCLMISDGYELVPQSYRLEPEQARKLLLSRRQLRYNCAQRDGDEVVLTRHTIRCPSCGLRRSATPSHVYQDVSVGRISKPDIDRWLYGQQGLWDDGVLWLHKLVIPDRWQCPSCGKTFSAGKNNTGVRIVTEKKRIEMLCRGMVDGQLMLEHLSFNLRTGRLVLTACSFWEEKRRIRDVTTLPADFYKSHCCRLLQENLQVRKKLYRHLRDLWGSNLPYALDETGVEEFAAMTRFVGYPRSFYAAIPWADGEERKIHPHFGKMAEKLHNAENLSKVMLGVPLCAFRCVRRIVTAQPAFLFYSREIAALFEALRRDPAALSKLLRSCHGFWLLGQLAAYPEMIRFLADFVEVRSLAGLIQLLERSAGMVRYYALEYGCMTPKRREIEKKTWEFFHTAALLPIGPGFSVPLRLEEASHDGCARDYQFRYLRSSRELVEAGKKLKNPLLGIQTEGTVVLITRRHGMEIIGAAQIYDGNVVCTQGIGDSPLSMDVVPALRDWCEAEHIGLFEDGECDDAYCF